MPPPRSMSAPPSTTRAGPSAWHHRTVFPAIMNIFTGQTKPGTWELDFGLTDLPYDIPNIQLESGEAPCHVRIGWKRSVQNIFHAFAINSFTNELAVAAGRDHAGVREGAYWAPTGMIDLTADGVTDYFNYDNDIAKYPIDTARLKNVLEIAATRGRVGQGDAGALRHGSRRAPQLPDLCRDRDRGGGCARTARSQSRAS